MTNGIFLLAAFLTGAIVGSFLNVCIYRIPRDISIMKPARSFCPHCEHSIPWAHNIPLFSWLALRGRCGFCKRPIGWRYPLVEMLTAVLFALAAFFVSLPTLSAILVFLSVLVVITFIDIEYFLIPDVLSKGGLAAGLVFSLLTPQLHHTSSAITAIGRSAAGALCGALILYLVTEVGKLVFGRYKVSFSNSTRFTLAVADGEPQILIDGEPFTWSEHFFRKSDRILVRADEVVLNG